MPKKLYSLFSQCISKPQHSPWNIMTVSMTIVFADKGAFPHLNSHRSLYHYGKMEEAQAPPPLFVPCKFVCRKQVGGLYVSRNHEVQGIKVIVKHTIAIFLLCLAV